MSVMDITLQEVSTRTSLPSLPLTAHAAHLSAAHGLQLLLNADDAVIDGLRDDRQLLANGTNQVIAQLDAEKAGAHIFEVCIASLAAEEPQLLCPGLLHGHLHACRVTAVQTLNMLRPWTSMLYWSARHTLPSASTLVQIAVLRIVAAGDAGSSVQVKPAVGKAIPQSHLRVDVCLAAVDHTDPAMLELDSLALENVTGICARVHDVQLGQHTDGAVAGRVHLSRQMQGI